MDFLFALAVAGAVFLLLNVVRPGFLLQKTSYVVRAEAPREQEPARTQFISLGDEAWTRKAQDAIRALGTNALPSLVALVTQKGDTRKTSQQLAVAGFGALGSNAAPAIPALTKLLDDPLPGVRSVAADCLQAIGPVASNAVPRLLSTLNDSDADVRKSAVRALMIIPGKSTVVVPALIAFLDGPRRDTNSAEFEKAASLAALRRYARTSPVALSAMRRMTNDPDANVRFKAGLYLRSIEGPSVNLQPGNPIDLNRNTEQKKP